MSGKLSQGRVTETGVMNNQQTQDIIGHWEVKWNYKHVRKVYASHYCCERLPYGNFHCASPYCADHCHRWEGKHYTRMKKGEDMNMYRLILPVGDIVPPPVLSSIWENFGRRLRRLYPGCEWYWVLELQNGNLHLHVLLKANDPVTYQEVNDKWRKTLKKRGLEIAENTVSVKAVGDEPEDYAAVCSYNTKSRRAKPWQYRPPSGLYRNLAFASRGFYKDTEVKYDNVKLDHQADDVKDSDENLCNSQPGQPVFSNALHRQVDGPADFQGEFLDVGGALDGADVQQGGSLVSRPLGDSYILRKLVDGSPTDSFSNITAC